LPPLFGPGDHVGKAKPEGRQALMAAEEGLAREACVVRVEKKRRRKR